jgi:hypothetical protein
MIGFNHYEAPPFLLAKINNICSLLWQGKKEYELVATTIADNDLRCTMLTLAQESNQYACELSSQIHTLGGVPEIEKNNEPELRDEIKNLNDENEILTFCKMNEKNIIGAYQEILDDSFLYEGLRKMILYQLNEMLCAFMQVKQLSSLKFH